MADLKPETFDIIGALSGITYPEHEVVAYLDDSVGFTMYTFEKAYELAVSTGKLEEAEKIQGEIDEFASEVAGKRITVKLRGIPESIRADIIAEVEETHPSKSDLLGRAEPNPKADRMLRRELWCQMITEIHSPDGAVNIPGEAEVDAMLSRAGTTFIEAVDTGIGELISGSKAGFEAAARNLDFLSSASQEDSEEA